MDTFEVATLVAETMLIGIFVSGIFALITTLKDLNKEAIPNSDSTPPIEDEVHVHLPEDPLVF